MGEPQAIETRAAARLLSRHPDCQPARRRLASFFGYQHRFEAYLPKEKRIFGYFAQPVLVGDEIVAVLDLKTDRERQKLLVQKWTWVSKGARAQCRKQIEEALHRFERFQLAR